MPRQGDGNVGALFFPHFREAWLQSIGSMKRYPWSGMDYNKDLQLLQPVGSWDASCMHLCFVIISSFVHFYGDVHIF